MSSGTYLGYCDEHGNEMHCARATCDDPACRKGCIQRIVRPKIELLPCPFCGSTPIVVTIEPHSHKGGIAEFMPDHPGSAYIDCVCGVGMIDISEEVVVNRWNLRVGEGPSTVSSGSGK